MKTLFTLGMAICLAHCIDLQAGGIAGTPPETVTLGEGNLLQGIPGQGSVTPEEMQQWLSDDSIHQPLNVKLPLGLSLGEKQMKGLEKNPLTRAKIELGRQLYFDPRLSSDSTVSCASCHHPQEGFSRHTQFGIGVDGAEGGRNSPSSYNRILSDKQFWDGRADSLEDQAIGPIANPIEMGNTHDACVKGLGSIEGYRLQFAKIFPKDGITIENVGKAIASFERAIVTGPTAYDYREALKPFLAFDPEDLEDMKEDDPEDYQKYLTVKQMAEANPMTESAIRGQNLFFSERVNCSACHVGANLADEQYHNLGIGMDAAEPDLGRHVVTKEEKDKGAFKTPTIRNVALSGPYMHDGSLTTLEEVVEHYNKGGTPNPWLSDKVKKLNLTNQEKLDLVEFMRSLTGSFPAISSGRLPE